MRVRCASRDEQGAMSAPVLSAELTQHRSRLNVAGMTEGETRSGLVGRVVALWRYPVKSMAGESLDAADVSWHGVAGDRRWAFIRPGMERSNFPWLTIRESPTMWRYRPMLAEPGEPDASRTFVRTPDGRDLEVVDPALAAELGEGVRVIKQNRGVFDTAPLSLISVQTVAALAREAGLPLDARRFRPNIVIDAPELGAFAEDAWVGSELQLGAVRMRVDRRDQRCVMVNVDPGTTERAPIVLRTIARERDACLGVYGSVVRPGRLTAGDPVHVIG